MSLSVDEVRSVAQLARIDFSDADLERLTQQLAKILEYVDQLRSVDTRDVEPLAHPLPVHNVFRSDALTPSLPVEATLSNAPQQRGEFFAVPAVMDQK